MRKKQNNLIRVTIFYDGNFFFHVSTFYRYVHPPRKRISISGLHEFIRKRIAEFENTNLNHVHIVSAHFFRGRLSAKEAELEDKLYSERVFEDILMNEGITTHYLPIRTINDRRIETGIDVWFALEAYDEIIQKELDILVLITGDTDFLPLIKKTQSVNAKVMVLGWDFKYTDEFGDEQITITSPELLDSATYPIKMHQIIEEGLKTNNPDVLNLFFDVKDEFQHLIAGKEKEHFFEGRILTLKDGYGFIACPDFPDNVFFHYSALKNINFQDLEIGMPVKFLVIKTKKGNVAQPVIAQFEDI